MTSNLFLFWQLNLPGRNTARSETCVVEKSRAGVYALCRHEMLGAATRARAWKATP